MDDTALPSLGLVAPVCAAVLVLVAGCYMMRWHAELAMLVHWLIVGLLCGLVAAEYATLSWFPITTHAPAFGLYAIGVGTIVAAAGGVLAFLGSRDAPSDVTVGPGGTAGPESGATWVRLPDQ